MNVVIFPSLRLQVQNMMRAALFDGRIEHLTAGIAEARLLEDLLYDEAGDYGATITCNVTPVADRVLLTVIVDRVDESFDEDFDDEESEDDKLGDFIEGFFSEEPLN